MLLAQRYQQQIIDTINQLPEQKLAEIIDFAEFLKKKYSFLCKNFFMGKILIVIVLLISFCQEGVTQDIYSHCLENKSVSISPKHNLDKNFLIAFLPKKKSTSQKDDKNKDNHKEDDLLQSLRAVSSTFSEIKDYYIDAEDVDYHDLAYKGIRHMVKSLEDDESMFIEPLEYQEMQKNFKEVVAVGLVIGFKDHKLTIVTPLKDTPAYKSGLKAGDQIIGIDGKLSENITLSEAASMLRGTIGSQVKVMVIREDKENPLEFNLTREVIEIKSITSQLIGEEIGYICLANITQGITEGLVTVLDDFKAKGIKKLILDLRNNPGGLLDVAVAITANFLPKKSLIVSTTGRLITYNKEYYSEKEPIWGNHLIVLINKGTAAGAEIIASAIQDNQQGVLVGSNSYGNNSIQTVIPFSSDGSALRLTISKWYGASGKDISKKGVIPDVVIEEGEGDTQLEQAINLLEEMRDLEEKKL